MLPRIPQIGGGPGRVSRNGNDLEVITELVAFGEGLAYLADLRGRPRIILVDVLRELANREAREAEAVEGTPTP